MTKIPGIVEIPASTALQTTQITSFDYDKTIEAYDGISRSFGSWSDFDNILPGQSGRPEFNRRAYEHFRPGEAVPKKYKDICKAIDTVYCSLSIVRNIIDLMSDFGCEGIDIVHPIPSIEKFYKEWFKKINGIDRSERFLSGIYRHGMVVAEHLDATIKTKNIQEISVGKVEVNREKYKKGVVPLKILFHNPANFNHINYHKAGEVPQYVIKVPQGIQMNNGMFDYFSDSFGEDRPISSEKLSVIYYKKDDWVAKPPPFMYPIIKHAIMLEKLALADSAALDGAISKIRIIKLGNLELGIVPSEAGISKMEQILRSNTGGGTIDIVWGPDVDIIESGTDISKFLGQEKYIPHLTQVYEGLGIPTSFTGVGQGTTNNYISLKVMTRRLISGRERLVQFWDRYIRQVQKSMGFAEPAVLEFNNLDLGDEESERQLIIQLLDREIVSEERVQKILGYDPRMENKRLSNERKQRKRGKRAEKASPFHNAQPEFTKQKIALEKGYYGPEHVGIQKEPGTEKVLSPNEQRFKEMSALKDSGGRMQDLTNENKKGTGGRPLGAKDSQKRKIRQFTPVSKASLEIWIEQSQATIHETLKPVILSTTGKKNLRELTAVEAKHFEFVKFGVLSNIETLSKISEDEILKALDNQEDSNLSDLLEYIRQFEVKNKKTASIEEIRMIAKHTIANRKIELC
jgi:hypothetical protein